MFARLILGGSLAASMALTPAAIAQQPVVVEGQPTDVPTERVRYADLDLATASGTRNLHGRVGGAIRRVCAANGTYGGTLERFYTACVVSARKQAGPQIAQAVERARQLAATGTTSIAAAAIVISAN